MRTPIAQRFSFGNGFIDPSLYELDEELKKVDQLLSQAILLKPFEEVFDEILGRPGTAVSWHNHRLGLESKKADVGCR